MLTGRSVHDQSAGVMYLLLNQTALSGWDRSRSTGEETEAESEQVGCQSGEVAELGFELTPP